VAHKDEVLFVAINEAKSMAAGGWRAPLPRSFPVAGRSGVATIKGSLVNMRDGGFISAYDYHLGDTIAEIQNRVAEVMGPTSTNYAAERIARSESARALSAAAQGCRT
jgi:hypothetical protein